MQGTRIKVDYENEAMRFVPLCIEKANTAKDVKYKGGWCNFTPPKSFRLLALSVLVL